MLDPKYVLNKGELSSLSARSYILRSVSLWVKGQSKYFQDLKADREECKGEKVAHLWLSYGKENTVHPELLLHL